MTATKMLSREFSAALDECGFTLITPDHPEFSVWGYIDIGKGPWVNRWLGGVTLADQLAFLKRVREGRDKAEESVPKKQKAATKAVAPKKTAKAAKKKVATPKPTRSKKKGGRK